MTLWLLAVTPTLRPPATRSTIIRAPTVLLPEPWRSLDRQVALVDSRRRAGAPPPPQPHQHAVKAAPSRTAAGCASGDRALRGSPPGPSLPCSNTRRARRCRLSGLGRGLARRSYGISDRGVGAGCLLPRLISRAPCSSSRLTTVPMDVLCLRIVWGTANGDGVLLRREAKSV